MAYNIRVRGFDSTIRSLRLTPVQVQRAGRSAVNKAARTVRNDILNEVKTKTGLQPSIARQRLTLDVAKQGGLRAVVIGIGRRIAIWRYRPKLIRYAKTRIGVMADISIRRGIQEIFRFGKKAFRVPGKGKKIIMARMPGAKRYPVKFVTGPPMARHLQTSWNQSRIPWAAMARTEFLAALRRQIGGPSSGSR